MLPMVHQHNFVYEAVGLEIAAMIDHLDITDVQNNHANVLSLHGAGVANGERIAYLTTALAASGHTCLRFTHSAQFNAEQDANKPSLKKRVDEALLAAKYLDPNRPITLIGTSMGGHIALELLPYLNVENLILFCPAIYSEAAYDVPFDSRFSDIIRQPNSFQQAVALKNLEAYKGRLMHIIGDNDGIIPQAVTNLYKQHTGQCLESKFLTIADAPHALHGWLEQYPDKRADLIDLIISFIGKPSTI